MCEEAECRQILGIRILRERSGDCPKLKSIYARLSRFGGNLYPIFAQAGDSEAAGKAAFEAELGSISVARWSS